MVHDGNSNNKTLLQMFNDRIDQVNLFAFLQLFFSYGHFGANRMRFLYLLSLVKTTIIEYFEHKS